MANSDFNDAIEENLAHGDFSSPCSSALHVKAIEGIQLFNQGRYWDAHEALEAAWIDEIGLARQLYKGILQAGVMYLQIERKNFIGMAKMYERAKKWLAPWPDVCKGVNIKKLRVDIEIAIIEAGKLGPDDLARFDHKLLKNIEFTM